MIVPTADLSHEQPELPHCQSRSRYFTMRPHPVLAAGFDYDRYTASLTTTLLAGWQVSRQFFAHQVDAPVPVRKRTMHCICGLLIQIRHCLIVPRLGLDRHSPITQPLRHLGLAPGDRSRTDRVVFGEIATFDHGVDRRTRQAGSLDVGRLPQTSVAKGIVQNVWRRGIHRSAS